MYKRLGYFITSISLLTLAACTNNQIVTQPTNGPTSEPLVIATKTYPVQNQAAALSGLNMNDQGNQVIVQPSSTIKVSTQYIYHCDTCKSDLNNQILVGLGGRSAQACIYNGGAQGQGAADFSLKAPAKPGKYDVRFLPIQAMDCNDALKIGWDADSSPSKVTTVGTILVSRKALG
jgi:hypothetical protein